MPKDGKDQVELSGHQKEISNSQSTKQVMGEILQLRGDKPPKEHC